MCVSRRLHCWKIVRCIGPTSLPFHPFAIHTLKERGKMRDSEREREGVGWWERERGGGGGGGGELERGDGGGWP